MNAETRIINSWTDLASALAAASEWSDPARATPKGTITFERLGDTKIVLMSMKVDIVPLTLFSEDKNVIRP